MADLDGQVALVTGASRGVGRGVALGLALAGAHVYATGRSVTEADAVDGVTTIRCDHRDDDAVADVFGRIADETGQLDICVNVAWGGYERMVEGDRFTWADPFWLQPMWRWDAMMTAGVRAAFVTSQHAAQMMIAAGHGLIVHISSFAGRSYSGNTIYGVAKSATDRLAADMGHKLGPHGVTAVSLYPGLVRTEGVLAAGVFDLSNSESPEFVGRAVAALGSDPNIARWNGQIVVAALLGREYGFTDVDGSQPDPLG
jgi:NAD(P)-dependent dehydrogenase (short-subunit alcohol dehydrogenase family)